MIAMAAESPRGLIISLIGFSGSGKSTVARGLVDRFRREGWKVMHMDRTADHQTNARTLAGAGSPSSEHELPALTLDHSEAEYRAFNEHLARAARDVSNSGVTVILSQISPYREIRERLRDDIGSDRYFEVHVDTPLEVCEGRDPKGLYRRARSGDIQFLPGVNSRFDPPVDPLATVRSQTPADVEEAVQQIAKRLGLHATPCSSFEGVVIDLFGTLVELPSLDARLAWLDEIGRSALPITRDRVVAGAWFAPLFEAMAVPYERGRDLLMTTRFGSVRAAADALATIAERSAPETLLARYEEGLVRWRRGYRWSPGARELLDALRSGGIPIALLSNADSFSAGVASELGVGRRVDAVLFSCDLGVAKPDVRAFQAAFDALCLSADQALVVGDGWNSDASGAVLAGASAVWVNRDRVAAPAGLPMPWRRRIVEVSAIDVLSGLFSHA